MYRFVMTIPKDIVKNIQKSKSIINKTPKINFSNKLQINILRINFKYNYYKQKFDNIMNMEVENNLYK